MKNNEYKNEHIENIRKEIENFADYLDELFENVNKDKNKKIISDPGDEDENVKKDKAPD
ncbi:MAG: hypothetical protein ACXACY_12995 [Candidatus Hodarchaeales archaeon]|jgi:hypothetical protein